MRVETEDGVEGLGDRGWAKLAGSRDVKEGEPACDTLAEARLVKPGRCSATFNLETGTLIRLPDAEVGIE